MEVGNGGGELKSDINVTPLVDVMLVLLIIFMLVTPLLQEGVMVDLPQARNLAGVTDDRNRTLIVVIKADGETYIDEERIDRANLGLLLAQRHNANPAVEFHIKADRNTSYGDVRRAVKAAREAGFRDAALVAEILEEEPGLGGG